ncbi:MAG: tetratricopeptide repeat protein [Burkholderiaceae bacterium]
MRNYLLRAKIINRNKGVTSLRDYAEGWNFSLKQLDKAFEHYRRALAINPQHRSAHEYIGEAYLMVNDVPAAERHLDSLRAICVLPCEELRDLEKAITEYRSRATSR